MLMVHMMAIHRVKVIITTVMPFVVAEAMLANADHYHYVITFERRYTNNVEKFESQIAGLLSASSVAKISSDDNHFIRSKPCDLSIVVETTLRALRLLAFYCNFLGLFSVAGRALQLCTTVARVQHALLHIPHILVWSLGNMSICICVCLEHIHYVQ